MTRSLDFALFSDDVNTQIKSAQRILEALKLLRDLEREGSTDNEKLKRASSLLEDSASQLIENATKTGREIARLGSAA